MKKRAGSEVGGGGRRAVKTPQIWRKRRFSDRRPVPEERDFDHRKPV